MGARPSPSELECDVDRLLDLVRSCGWLPEGRAQAECKARLWALAVSICHWNDAINLVSRKDIGRLVSYHFCDSASVLPTVGWRSGLRVLDVGGSNGLPGLVVAALVPEIRLTICDAREKRRGFLEEVCAEGRASFEIGRVDTEAFQDRHRESFDLVLARAVTRMRLLVRWCMPLLSPHGRLVAYKGSRCEDEIGQAEADIFGTGGTMAAVVASPLTKQCNPLRLFAITGRG